MSQPVHFSSHTLCEILADVYFSERSGILRVRRDGEEKRIHFKRGLIHYAESSVDGEQLGQVLIRDGRLSTGALAEARRGLDDPLQLPLVLVNRGLVSKSDVEQALKRLIDEIVCSVFTWPGGTAEFTESDESAEVWEADVLSTFQQLLNGISQTHDFEPIRDAMHAQESPLTLREPSPLPLDRLALSRSQGYVLSRVDGRTSFRDAISTLPAGEDDPAARFLFGLLITGVLQYDPPLADGPFRVANILRNHADRKAMEKMQEKTIKQAYRRMRTQNPHEILGVTPNASRRAIDRAYGEAKALFDRERLLPSVLEAYRAELGVIETRLIEAYLQLTQPERTDRREDRDAEKTGGAPVDVQDLLVRPELDKTKTRVAKDEASRVAELYYSKARQAMRSGDFHNAIQYGKLAISYNGDDARFYYMLADCQVRNPEARWQRMAEENYTRATQLDPWNADYWISLGKFYKKRGLNLRARRQFEEALKLVPEHEVATQELRGINE